MRSKANVAVYLILKKSHKLLLSLRENTGYQDGNWSLVSGHVDAGEPAIDGMIREANEEVGIKLLPENLQVVHIMPRKSLDRESIDVFLSASSCVQDGIVFINRSSHTLKEIILL